MEETYKSTGKQMTGGALEKSHPDPLPLPGISTRIREFGIARGGSEKLWDGGSRQRPLPPPYAPLAQV